MVCLAGRVSHLTPVPSDPDALRAWLAEPGRVDTGALSDVFSNPEIELPPAPEETLALTVDITLRHTEPRVWRRVVVPGDLTLDRVHDVVQAAMGWGDYHLHRFHAGDSESEPYFVTDDDLDEGEEGTREDDARLDQLLRAPGDSIRYVYDFGDGWQHDLRLADLAPLGHDARLRCIGGERECPPEDVGGVDAYGELAAWVRAGRPRDGVPPQFKSLEHAVDWLPLDWHPDSFEVEEADLRLRAAVATTEILARLRPEALGALLRLTQAGSTRASEWLASAAQTSLSSSDLAELTAPYQRLLTVIGGGVELTTAGYLRPAVVRQLVAALDVDPVLAGKTSSEIRVRPLAIFRKVVQQTGLVHSQYKLLMPTVAGIEFRDDPSGLWRHVRSRLPVGRTELKKEIGWFTLLALAGGVGRSEVYGAVHQLCVDAGWADDRGDPIAPDHVNELVWPTLAALLGPRWSARADWPAWTPAAAASALFA